MQNATKEFEDRLDEIKVIGAKRNETVVLRNTVKSEITRLRSKLDRVRSIANRVSYSIAAFMKSCEMLVSLIVPTETGVSRGQCACTLLFA